MSFKTKRDFTCDLCEITESTDGGNPVNWYVGYLIQMPQVGDAAFDLCLDYRTSIFSYRCIKYNPPKGTFKKLWDKIKGKK